MVAPMMEHSPAEQLRATVDASQHTDDAVLWLAADAEDGLARYVPALPNPHDLADYPLEAVSTMAQISAVCALDSHRGLHTNWLLFADLHHLYASRLRVPGIAWGAVADDASSLDALVTDPRRWYMSAHAEIPDAILPATLETIAGATTLASDRALASLRVHAVPVVECMARRAAHARNLGWLSRLHYDRWAKAVR